MPLSWNEIRSRALAFSREWADAASENAQAKPFWIDFFDVFNQRSEVATIFQGTKNAGLLDYVACWYRKAAEYMACSSPLKGRG